RPAHHRPPGRAVRVRRGHPRPAAAAHAVLVGRGRTLARGAGLRAGADRPSSARSWSGLGYSEPCELRRMPVGRTMSALHASSQWRRYAGQVSAGSPSDVWREGCWRFVVYPGYARGRPVDIVSAVCLQSRRPAVRAAVLDADTDEVLGPTGTRESAVL